MSDLVGQIVKVRCFGQYQDCRVLAERPGGNYQVQPLGTPQKRRLVVTPEEINAEGGSPAPVEPEPAAPAGDAILALDGTVDDVEKFVATVDDPEVLDRLAAEEGPVDGGGRKGVHYAIAARLEELAGDED